MCATPRARPALRKSERVPASRWRTRCPGARPPPRPRPRRRPGRRRPARRRQGPRCAAAGAMPPPPCTAAKLKQRTERKTFTSTSLVRPNPTSHWLHLLPAEPPAAIPSAPQASLVRACVAGNEGSGTALCMQPAPTASLPAVMQPCQPHAFCRASVQTTAAQPPATQAAGEHEITQQKWNTRAVAACI